MLESSPGTVSWSYLQVLARCSEPQFKEKLMGRTLTVAHLENNLYYEELLGLHKSRAAEPMDMEDDAGVLGGGQLALERVSKRKPVFRLADSFVWGCVTFKYRSPTGTNKWQQGYQVDCPRASHRVKRKNGAFMLKTLFVDL